MISFHCNSRKIEMERERKKSRRTLDFFLSAHRSKICFWVLFPGVIFNGRRISVGMDIGSGVDSTTAWNTNLFLSFPSWALGANVYEESFSLLFPISTIFFSRPTFPPRNLFSLCSLAADRKSWTVSSYPAVRIT